MRSGRRKNDKGGLTWIPGYTDANPAIWDTITQNPITQPNIPLPQLTFAEPSSDPNYIDSAYALALANQRANINAKLSQVQQEDANDETTYREALRRMDTQRPRDDSAAKASANKAGLFYSGTLGKNLGDIATSYAQKQADMLNSRQQRANTRQSQLAQLNAGYDVDVSGIADDAISRGLTSDTAMADAGYLVRDLGSGGTPAVPKGVVPAMPRPVHTQSTSRRAVSPVRPMRRRRRAVMGARALGSYAGGIR